MRNGFDAGEKKEAALSSILVEVVDRRNAIILTVSTSEVYISLIAQKAGFEVSSRNYKFRIAVSDHYFRAILGIALSLLSRG